MEVQLRAPLRRFHPLMRRGFSGLGTCQWPQPGVAMVYPPCEGSVVVAPVSSSTFGSSSSFIAPAQETPESCVDPASGYALADPACVERNLARQHRNQSAWDIANRAVFLTNCHDMIAAENESRRARGLPLQVDDCDQRTFGQTLPGTSGSDRQAQIQPTYVASPASQAPVQKTAVETPVASGGNGKQSTAPQGNKATVLIGETEIPMWAIIAAVGVGLFLMTRAK